MALMIGCDVCGKFIKNVPWENRSEINNTEVCNSCKKKQEALDKAIDKARNKFDHQFNQILVEAKEELKQVISKIANENKQE